MNSAIIDFGWNDNAATIGCVNVTTSGTGERKSAAVIIKKTSDLKTWPSGWIVKIDGMYGWDAAWFVDHMMYPLKAGPFGCWFMGEARKKVNGVRDLFVSDTTFEAMSAALVSA
jgi:hypothetical protein